MNPYNTQHAIFTAELYDLTSIVDIQNRTMAKATNYRKMLFSAENVHSVIIN